MQAVQSVDLLDGLAFDFDANVKGRSGRRVDIFRADDSLSAVERNHLADLLVEYYRSQFSGNLHRRLEIVERFRNCGKMGSVHRCLDCGSRFYTRFYCKCRLCDDCSRIYGREIQAQVRELLKPCFSRRKKGWTIALLTLSESSGRYRGGYPTKEQVKEFNRKVGAFCRLFYGKYRGRFTKRGRVVEDRRCYLGAGTFSVNEFGSDNNNLHAHIILYGPWVAWRTLRDAWFRLSGGDTGVYIEPIHDAGKAVAYVSKYLTKAPRFSDPYRAVAFLVGLHGSRRIRSGGVFYNRVRFKQPRFFPDACPFCDTLLVYDGVVNLRDCSSYMSLRDLRSGKIGPDQLFRMRENRSFLPRDVMPC